jgi:RND family efflux transporter MFP subunit
MRLIIRALFCLLLIVPLSSIADLKVTTLPWSELAESRTFDFPARVVSQQVADIAAETSGRILSFQSQVGDSIEQGQTLVRFDCTNSQLNLERAQAALKRLNATRELTEQQLQRANRLSASKSISREELDQRKTQLAADNASIEEQQAVLASAEQAVRDCNLRAPFSGVIVEKHLFEGAYANPGTPVLQLLKPDAVELELDLPGYQVSELKKADQIEFVVNGSRYPIRIRSVLPRFNSQNLQRQVRLVFTGKETPLAASYGVVEIQSARHFLPAKYLQRRNGELGYFRYTDGQAEFVPVSGAQEGQSTQLDLDASVSVIIEPLHRLQPMDAVEVTQ